MSVYKTYNVEKFLSLKSTDSLITWHTEWIVNDVGLLCVKSLLYVLHFTSSVYFELL